jgi:hypothetical protein
MNRGPVETAFTGPILSGARFEEVLVAKAVSHTGEDLDLVLYNNGEAGVFELGVSRLKPGMKYSVGQEETVVADQKGEATIQVKVDGRTQVLVQPVA